MNVPFTSQPTPGATPALLFTVTSLKVGEVEPVNDGATVPLKVTDPVLVKPALRAIDCGEVPGKITAPPDVKVPEFTNAPAKVVWVFPA